jgi:L-proline amide hydrolase
MTEPCGSPVVDAQQHSVGRRLEFCADTPCTHVLARASRSHCGSRSVLNTASLPATYFLLVHASQHTGVGARNASTGEDDSGDNGQHRYGGDPTTTRFTVKASTRTRGCLTAQMDVREGYVDFRGYRTWYRVAGELESGATPLLALHGGPGSTHNYFAPLERLAAERPVVLYDQIGCGSSDRPTDIEWSIAVFREEVDAVREQLGLDRIHLLGTSWGGMLALEHVLSGARGIVSLVLSSTLANVNQWAEEQLKLRAQLPPEVIEVFERHERAGTYDDPEYERAMDVYFDRHFYRGPQPREELERMSAEKATDVYRAMQGPNEWTVTGAMKGWDVRNRLKEIDVPTLVVRGRYDMCTDPIAATLVDGIRGAREVVLEKSSHTPVLEETDRYLEVVGGFLREAESGGGRIRTSVG